jgi:hypothetical protein
MERLLPTDEDLDIRLDRACNRHPASWIHNLNSDERDAQIMRAIAKSRKNNRRIRACADEPGMVAVA